MFDLNSMLYLPDVSFQLVFAYTYCKYNLFADVSQADPRPCAGTIGTTITVEDLFYNMQTRRQAFKNPTEQYQRILDVVTKYSVHFGENKVSFTCKKQGQAMSDLHTPMNSSTLENIKIAYGAAVSKELIKFELEEGSCPLAEDGNLIKNDPQKCGKKIDGKKDGLNLKDQDDHGFNEFEMASNHDNNISMIDNNDTEGKNNNKRDLILTSNDHNDILSFSMKGLISNANYSSKKGICIIFINNRLVECLSVKKVIEAVYSEVLPRHSHPFIYLSIRMPCQHVDVNVHPVSAYVDIFFEFIK